MHLTKGRGALAAAMMLLALAPASGLAAGKHPRLRPHLHGAAALACRVSLFAEPRFLTSGESAQLFGTLSCPNPANAVGQTVAIYQHSAGVGGFKLIGSATTATGGSYSFVSSALSRNSVFYALVGRKRSPSRTVKVAPVVTLAGPSEATQLRTGVRNGVTFTGSVRPALAGATVVLQRENATSSEEWLVIQRSVVNANGTFVLVHRFGTPGDANIRVVVNPRGPGMLRGISNSLSYVISQPQNPRLTIFSSADPAAYGQVVTISGRLAGGAHQSVSLTSRRRGAAAFANVAQATADANGEYRFTITALRNTAYRVLAGGTHSAVLFEGVKYAVTATVSATTLPSGQAVTFSGTITPNRPGHVVSLERENAFGRGFHIADVGIVSANGTYAITHYVFGRGKQVYRIHVPGDPENQRNSSQTFTIEVTPPAPGSLRRVPDARQPRIGRL